MHRGAHDYLLRASPFAAQQQFPDHPVHHSLPRIPHGHPLEAVLGRLPSPQRADRGTASIADGVDLVGPMQRHPYSSVLGQVLQHFPHDRIILAL